MTLAHAVRPSTKPGRSRACLEALAQRGGGELAELWRGARRGTVIAEALGKDARLSGPRAPRR
eukprot:5092459-Alexandrium_andersonii.AAC.1